MTQQARNMVIRLGETVAARKMLIRDREVKLRGTFDEVFRSKSLRIIRAPVRSQRANAFPAVGVVGLHRLP
jgi:hypothetical protein